MIIANDFFLLQLTCPPIHQYKDKLSVVLFKLVVYGTIGTLLRSIIVRQSNSFWNICIDKCIIAISLNNVNRTRNYIFDENPFLTEYST